MKWKTDPLLPALVERLGLVHAIPVASKVPAVPVVEVAVLVAKVAPVTSSLVILQGQRDTDYRGAEGGSRLGGVCGTYVSRMAPVSSTTHLASASSVHVPPVARTASAHVAPSGSHVPPHGAAPGRPTQDGHVAPVEVPTSREASSDV